jgi:excisionase family DNA binding protein
MQTKVNPTQRESFVSRSQAAQLLSVSLSTVDKLIETGRLPAYRVLRAVRLKLSDVISAAVPR